MKRSAAPPVNKARFASYHAGRAKACDAEVCWVTLQYLDAMFDLRGKERVWQLQSYMNDAASEQWPKPCGQQTQQSQAVRAHASRSERHIDIPPIDVLRTLRRPRSRGRVGTGALPFHKRDLALRDRPVQPALQPRR